MSRHPGSMIARVRPWWLRRFIGGIIGAGGAVWAVFLLLSRQRNEETQKVAEAVRTEVTTLVKYVIGAVDICEQIKKGVIKLPRQDAHYIVKNFAGDPVIYPAVADRVDFLRRPHAITEFYMRILEAKVMVEMLRTKTDAPGIMYTAARVELVTPEFAGSVADSLLTALQLASSIVADEEIFRWKITVHSMGAVCDCCSNRRLFELRERDISRCGVV